MINNIKFGFQIACSKIAFFMKGVSHKERSCTRQGSNQYTTIICYFKDIKVSFQEQKTELKNNELHKSYSGLSEGRNDQVVR